MSHASECAQARRQPVCFDLSHRAKVELRGPDRAASLQNFCTNDVVKTPVGGGCEAFLLTAQAKIVARMLVYVAAEALWIDADEGRAGPIIDHLTRYQISEQVEFFDRSAALGQFHVTGLGCDLALTQITGGPLPQAELQHSSPLSPVFGGEGSGVRGLHLRRNDPLGQPGYDLLVATAQTDALRPALDRAGIPLLGGDVFNILRVEAGTPEFGRDIDETNLPQEVNRDARAISFTKGCYIGQETVARIRSYGHVNRLLVGVRFEGSETVAGGAKLCRGGQEVGRITSGVVSPALGAIALAYVRRGHNAPGTEVQTEGGRLGRVVALPFFLPSPPSSGERGRG
jgi:folate-binding protein YgfZ